MKWFLQRVLAALAAVLVVALGAALLVRLQYRGEPGDWAASNGGDALWLDHAWVDGRYIEDALDELKPRIAEGGIRDVYVDAGPLGSDGELTALQERGPANLLRMLRDELPEVRVSVGMRQPTGVGEFLFGEQERRSGVVESAASLVDDGFDGVHYNFNAVPNNSPEMLALLESTRAELGEDVLLSSSVPQVEPLGGLAFTVGLLTSEDPYWSSGYLGRVAEHLDQVAIKSYGTGMPTEGLYGGFVVRQTQQALDAVPEEVHLLMGVPAYPDDHVEQNPQTETTEAAARAVRLGLTESGERRERFGTAFYTDFAATDKQWRAYMDGWAQPQDAAADKD